MGSAKLQAYAVLDGGGVKGAALAGCLQAAEKNGIHFLGYGGTSAGAIVAFLATIGLTPDEMRDWFLETDVAALLGGDYRELADCASALVRVEGAIALLRFLYTYRRSIKKLRTELGLFDGQPFRDLLLSLAKQKLGVSVANSPDITFDDLTRLKRPLLKVVVSDLKLRGPVVHSAVGGDEKNGSVIDAVRASMSYPLVFTPVDHAGRKLVDGGLSSNLPVFVFDRERRSTGLPIIAFDLVSEVSPRPPVYGLRRYLADLMETAIDSGDRIQRQISSNVYHVPILIPSSVRTLSFDLSRAERENLYNIGYRITDETLKASFPHWVQATNPVEGLQAIHVPSGLLTPVLETVARKVAEVTKAKSVRSQIMLPTGRGTRVVVYHFGMDGHPDSDLELSMEGGCSGQAWTSRRIAVADLEQARATYDKEWHMTAAQQSKVRPDVKSMCSVPIFDTSDRLARSASDLEIIGVLSVDSESSLSDAGWKIGDSVSQPLSETMTRWADIIAEILR